MRLIVPSMLILLPVITVAIATVLALACKYHPLNRADIIGQNKQKDSDLNTRGQLIAAIAISLVGALILTGVLAALTSATIRELLQPLLQWLEKLDANVFVVVYAVLVLAMLVPPIAKSQTWMTPWRGVLVGIGCTAVLVSWIVFYSWITHDVLVCVVATIFITVWQQRLSFLRLSVILLFLAVIYDAVQVYATSKMQAFAASVMPDFARGAMAIPTLLLAPENLSLAAQRFGILGIGDVVVFGLMAVSSARFAKKTGTWLPVVAIFAGFIVAMTLCLAVSQYFNSGQPATIYIVPLCALPVMICAKWRGTFDQLSVPFYGPGEWRKRRA